jgi:hypothetical protein
MATASNVPLVTAKAKPRLANRSVALLFVAAVLLAVHPAAGSSLVPTTEAEDFAAATGVCRGRVLSVEAFRHPDRAGIFTRVRLEVLESLKAAFPPTITIVQRGGVLGGEGETTGLGVNFRPGDEFLLHVGRRSDGSLTVLRGGDGATLLGSAGKAVASAASKKLARVRRLARPQARNEIMITGEDFAEVQGIALTASAGTADVGGLLVDDANIPSRFTAPDRGQPIGYLVDAQTLPEGITQDVALRAVTNALAAWSAQTSLTFRFEGLEDFGESPASVAIADGRLRIALHDSYGEIPSDSTLGIGGRAYVFGDSFQFTGGDGGAVDGLEFHETTRGFVVLNHTSPTMQNAKSFEEVLCHEIGHVLGLAHSSEDAAESDTLLSEAMMYYRVHADDRGATLGGYDIPVVRKVHPHDDTPPFSDDRILTLVTSPAPISGIAGINEILLGAGDRQSASPSLTLVTTGPEEGSVATGTFDGNLLQLTQTADYGDGTIDPASGGYYYRKYIRFSDGANASPWASVRVVMVRRDSQGDGLPDSWSLEHFGTAIPSAAALNRPADDPDRDGLTNLEEFLLGTVPVDAASRLAVRSFDGRTIEWHASPYALYTLESSTDLTTWQPYGLPVVPVTIDASTRVDFLPSPSTPKQFLRVRFGYSP